MSTHGKRQMIGAARLVAFSLSLGVAACDSPSGRSSSTDCGVGEVYVDGDCRHLCTSDLDCAELGKTGNICDDDFCTPGSRSVPTIVAVEALGADAGDGLLLSGENLTGAGFTLADGERDAGIEVVNQSDTEVVLAFLPSVTSGQYTLTATNAAGDASASVTLSLPEVTSDQVLQKLNGSQAGWIEDRLLSSNIQRSLTGDDVLDLINGTGVTTTMVASRVPSLAAQTEGVLSYGSGALHVDGGLNVVNGTLDVGSNGLTQTGGYGATVRRVVTRSVKNVSDGTDTDHFFFAINYPTQGNIGAILAKVRVLIVTKSGAGGGAADAQALKFSVIRGNKGNAGNDSDLGSAVVFGTEASPTSGAGQSYDIQKLEPRVVESSGSGLELGITTAADLHVSTGAKPDAYATAELELFWTGYEASAPTVTLY